MKHKINGPQREKHWEELTTDEKVERIREIVKQQQRSIEYMRAKIDKLEEHSHDNGKLMIPYRERCNCEKPYWDEMYF